MKICSGMNFPAVVGPAAPKGNNYGCLSKQPGPSWFFFEVDRPGNIAMNVKAAKDIDFIAWGPFNSERDLLAACGKLKTQVSCSFSGSKTETVKISNAKSGQHYMILITNYAKINQNVNASAAPGNTGSMKCPRIPKQIL